MKTLSAAIILALSAFAAAQELAPSPTESVGCEPHGDHWHCDGPRETAPATTATPVIITASEVVAVPATTTAAAHDDDHDHEQDHDHDDEDHDHEDEEDHDHDDHSAGVLPPSPTASIGCEPHGDHWHCDGPAPTTIATVTTSGVASGTGAPVITSTGPVVTAGAVAVHGGVGAAAGVLGLVGFMIAGI
ncbi:hypothetical protein QC764_206695 [Podospora pseudoanserina]|uniref:Uncharacterized protein n=1 Tax=Podospora pseudoanserina TaxID=2609844 RepID=A0ABR0IH45_9PEZI|nr:hypothetical protein QC764_206695 [Podospora pseudoanserina]